MALLPLPLVLQLPNLRPLNDSRNAVAFKQQQLWVDFEPARCFRFHRRIVLPAKQRLPINCRCLHGIRQPAKLGGPGETIAASPAEGLNTEGIAHKERQELLWQDLFLDPAQWWDHRPGKRNARHPDFTHKISKEPLWVNNFYRPPWVDLQLAIWDSRTKGHVGFASLPLTVETAPSICKDAEVEGVSDKHLSNICEHGELREAVEALELLLQRGSEITESLLYRLLKRCMARKDLNVGIRIHSVAMKSGHASNSFVANHIIGMYASHGKLEEAVQGFSKVTEPNAYMWASIIWAHARQGRPNEAIQLYRRMRESTQKPDSHVYVAALRACTTAQDLASGKEVHADILGSAVDVNIFIGNCLVDMYSKCGSLEDARRVFDKLPTRDVVTWTAMISGYAQHGLGQEALTLYASMQEEGMPSADSVTFVCLLQACAGIGDLAQGREFHLDIQERGMKIDVVMGSCLVDMYVKCGSLVEARSVFDRLPTRNAVTWNAMLGGYAQQGLCQEALSLYASMRDEGTSPVDQTFVCLLKACASVGAFQEGKKLHVQIKESGLETNLVVGSSLVDMYAKCGRLEDARNVFDRLPSRDVVTWNTMISRYAQQELGQEALALYGGMEQEGISPNRGTFVGLLQACASVGALHQGKQLQSQIRESGLETDIAVGTSLVDMFAKCGHLEDARSVFDKLLTKDVVAWTCLLNGYAEHSDDRMALLCYEEMLQQGVEPNDTTFISLLVVCSHAGLVDEGQRYFKTMVEDHRIIPSVSHYNCMVDLFGRSGHLDEAENVLSSSSFNNDIVGWTSLLSACKSHGDVERGRRCFDKLTVLEPENASSYVLMGNIYANAGRWKDVESIERLRMGAGAKKKPARACVEVMSKVHEFTVGEETSDVSLKLRNMSARFREEGGHVPQTELVLKTVSEQEKEDLLCGHAEKLALAYGLLNTPDGTTLLVTKNLRMCNDCHSSTKIMSRAERRTIVVRDAHRVHRFLDGSCSCGDRN